MMNNGEDELFSGFAKAITEYTKKNIDKCLPCIVEKVNAGRTVVTVRPFLQKLMDDESQIERGPISGLPVFTGGADNLLISFPIKVGSIGWIESTDRDISLFLQNYSSQPPPTDRKHSFSDARFIPDMMHDFTINSEDADAVVIQNMDGSVKIAVDDNQIRVENNDARIEMDSDNINITTSAVSIQISGSSVTGTAPGGFDLNGFTIDASGAAESPVSLTAPLGTIGTVAATTALTLAGVPVADGEHTHGAGSYAAGGDSVTGTSASSNG